MIIDGLISICVCIPQLFLLPEVPARLEANFMFSEQEVNMAKDRHPKDGRKESDPITISKASQSLHSTH